MVVFNGFYVGRHSGGYDPFSFDVTGFANPSGRNVLLVRVDATSSDGWFYEGAGIYRHVWLVKTNPVHVKQWGTFVTSQVRPGEAALTIRTELENHGKGEQRARVISSILDPLGKEVGKAGTDSVSIPEGGERTLEQKIAIKQPQLWSLEERSLYTLVTEVKSEGDVVDRYSTTFGIRSIRFDAEKGFFLNDKPVKLKGTCNHQDHAGVGGALPDRIQYYRVERLKDMGSNAYRTSHNPPTPELVDACDQLGMLMMCETRMMDSTPENQHGAGQPGRAQSSEDGFQGQRGGEPLREGAPRRDGRKGVRDDQRVERLEQVRRPEDREKRVKLIGAPAAQQKQGARRSAPRLAVEDR